MKKAKSSTNCLQRHTDCNYEEDLKHIYSLNNINPSKRDWIETTMLCLREKANIYEKKFGKFLLSKHIKFIHQAPFVLSGKIYFADFYFPQQRLIIEIDGDYHQSERQLTYDKVRDTCFAGHNVKVLRIPNNVVNDEQALNILLSKFFSFEVNEKLKDGNIVLFERLKKTFKNRVKMRVPYPINGRKYIPNIVIKSLKLAIEVIDNHNNNSDEYKIYDEDFKSIGYTTLRFSNEMVSSKKGKQDIIKQILEIANLKK